MFVVFLFFCIGGFSAQIFPGVFKTFWWYIGLSLMRIAWYRRMRNCWTLCPRGSSSINPITPSDKPFLPLYVKWVFGAATFSVTTVSPALLTSQTLQSILVFLSLILPAFSTLPTRTNKTRFQSIFVHICRSHRKSIRFSWSCISRCPSTVLVL